MTQWISMDTAPKDGTPIIVKTDCPSALHKRAIVSFLENQWVVGRTHESGKLVPLHCAPTGWLEAPEL